jgi:hypothetical protein
VVGEVSCFRGVGVHNGAVSVVVGVAFEGAFNFYGYGELCFPVFGVEK